MTSLLKHLLKYCQLNSLVYLWRGLSQNRQAKIQNRQGFTLVELLVAIALSAIVVSTLLAFVNQMISTERREQAKATTEQEIQAALDYIADDLQEAVYIYDADGIAAIESQLPNAENPNRVPVLVFWKRAFLHRNSEVILDDGSLAKVGCLAKIPGTESCNERDYFAYSLVAYYLIKNSNSLNSPWSNAARVGRFEIQNGVIDPNNPGYFLPGMTPDPGFQLFDLTLPGNIKDKMNAWTKDEARDYDLRHNKIETLVDYVDHSIGPQVPAPVDCEIATSPQAQQVPELPEASPVGGYGFYACVDSTKTLVRVYLRGNALARIDQNATYSNSQSAFFPTGNVQVRSRGKVNE